LAFHFEFGYFNPALALASFAFSNFDAVDVVLVCFAFSFDFGDLDKVNALVSFAFAFEFGNVNVLVALASFCLAFAFDFGDFNAVFDNSTVDESIPIVVPPTTTEILSGMAGFILVNCNVSRCNVSSTCGRTLVR
jgi:hypothetical protein